MKSYFVAVVLLLIIIAAGTALLWAPLLARNSFNKAKERECYYLAEMYGLHDIHFQHHGSFAPLLTCYGHKNGKRYLVHTALQTIKEIKQ